MMPMLARNFACKSSPRSSRFVITWGRWADHVVDETRGLVDRREGGRVLFQHPAVLCGAELHEPSEDIRTDQARFISVGPG